jgi:hypothetical protein
LLLSFSKEQTMQASSISTDSYAKVIANSKRVRWDIEDDVLRGRRFDLSKPFLPSGLSLASELPFLRDGDRRLFSQVQGRSYAYIFGLVERFISAKMLEVSRAHSLGDQVALEALVRMTDEEIKHQELFRRLETLMAADMPAGYRRAAEPNAVAVAVLGKSTWAVLALTLHIELFTQAHYRASNPQRMASAAGDYRTRNRGMFRSNVEASDGRCAGSSGWAGTRGTAGRWAERAGFTARGETFARTVSSQAITPAQCAIWPRAPAEGKSKTVSPCSRQRL